MARTVEITVEYIDGFTDKFELDEKVVRLACPDVESYQGVLSLVDSMSRFPSVRSVAFRIVPKEG